MKRDSDSNIRHNSVVSSSCVPGNWCALLLDKAQSKACNMSVSQIRTSVVVLLPTETCLFDRALFCYYQLHFCLNPGAESRMSPQNVLWLKKICMLLDFCKQSFLKSYFMFMFIFDKKNSMKMFFLLCFCFSFAFKENNNWSE